ncbi:MAG: flavodoxin domain-containing protein [Actinomycetota bacterium]
MGPATETEGEMAGVLVAYGSKMGGTAEIAARVADTLRGRGHQVTVAPAGQVPRRAAFDAAVVGSALYMGRWRREAVRLLKRLARSGEKPSRLWLFHSGPLGDEHADDPVGLPRKVQALAEGLGAEDVVTFGGRLDSGAPGFVAKSMARNGMAGDWRRLDHAEAWANTIAGELEG